CIVLEEIGRAVAPVPYLATVVLGALTVDRFGNPQQRADLLPPVVAGEAHLTAALVEPGNDDPGQPTTVAARHGEGWTLDGTKVCVPAAHAAGRVLVPAATGPGQTTVFLVDPRADGVELEREATTANQPEAL